MNLIYQHKQFGQAMLVILIIPTLVLIAGVGVSRSPVVLLPLLIVLVVMTAAMFIFGSLTVEVYTGQVALYFGPGLLRRSIPLEQIAQVRIVRNPLWMGLGIHFFRGGVIYNVSGLDGIEITLDDGRLVRIGSDEPADLMRAIESAKQQSA